MRKTRMTVTPFLISKLQRNKTANHVIYKENVRLFAEFGVKSQSIRVLWLSLMATSKLMYYDGLVTILPIQTGSLDCASQGRPPCAWSEVIYGTALLPPQICWIYCVESIVKDKYSPKYAGMLLKVAEGGQTVVTNLCLWLFSVLSRSHQDLIYLLLTNQSSVLLSSDFCLTNQNPVFRTSYISTFSPQHDLSLFITIP